MSNRAADPGEPSSPLIFRAAGRLRSRLAAAHLLMLAAGALAFVLMLLILRDRGAVAAVAISAVDLEPGVILDGESVRFVELPAAVAELSGVVTPTAFDLSAGWRVAHAVPEGALLRVSDLAAGSVDVRRLMSFVVDTAVTESIGPGDLIDVVTVRDRTAAYAATGLTVTAVDSGTARSRATFTVVVGHGEDLHIAEALAGGDLHIVRTRDG